MATIETFESLASAARASFPPQHCRIVATREHGDAGYVLFDTAPTAGHYLYGVNYERVDERWMEGISSNGSGWSHVGQDPDLGTLTDWGIAPAGADRARVEVDGELYDEPVENGVYLFVWWRVPADHDIEYGPIRFRINGRWV